MIPGAAQPSTVKNPRLFIRDYTGANIGIAVMIQLKESDIAKRVPSFGGGSKKKNR